MPESVPDAAEKVTRRSFVGWAFGLGAGFITLTLGIPIAAFVSRGSAQAAPGEFVKVADVADIPTGEPYGVSFVETAQDAYNYAQVPHSVYVMKNSDTDIVVYSPVCPHLGCQVFFDREKKQYVCPCHGSVFTEEGARIAGPTPRGLDVLPSKIDQGALYVRWVQYQPGIAEKIPV